MVDHDGGYKRLFSEPRMVQDLLTGFIPGDWVRKLDFSTLEPVKSDPISDQLDRRVDDAIWKVRLKDNSCLYICILLEFQSTPERFMPLRILTYLSLLYEDVVRSGQLLPGKKLPPVLPIVLYNGKTRWTLSARMHDLIEHISDDLTRYVPNFEFLLIDENAFSRKELSSDRMKNAKNLVAALFRLEQSMENRDILAIVEELLTWLAMPDQQSLSRAMAAWMDRVMRPSKPEGADIPAFSDLTEVQSMLRETVQEWYRP
jgi:hypothetical protein